MTALLPAIERGPRHLLCVRSVGGTVSAHGDSVVVLRQRSNHLEAGINRHAIARADCARGREHSHVRPAADIEVADRLPDDRRVGDSPELDKVEVAGVVEHQARRGASSDRLPRTLDVEYGCPGEIGAEVLAQGGKQVGIIEGEVSGPSLDRVRAV